MIVTRKLIISKKFFQEISNLEEGETLLFYDKLTQLYFLKVFKAKQKIAFILYPEKLRGSEDGEDAHH